LIFVDNKLTLISLRQLFFVAAVVYSGSCDFLCGQYKQLFVSELNNAYFFQTFALKAVFEWLGLA